MFMYENNIKMLKKRRSKRDMGIINTEETNQKKNNPFCLTGFIMGLFSVFLGGVVGILPILTIIFSAIGLSKFDESINKSKWQGITGLILGILYTLVYLNNYGHI
jgi:uncharacterized membrane protein HdeD (DUF308 family)